MEWTHEKQFLPVRSLNQHLLSIFITSRACPELCDLLVESYNWLYRTMPLRMPPALLDLANGIHGFDLIII